MNFTLEQIAHLIGGKLDGSKDTKVNTISSIEDAEEGSISFLSNPKYEPLIYTTRASAVIVDENLVLNKSILILTEIYSFNKFNEHFLTANRNFV